MSKINTSDINTSHPQRGSAYTSNVRDNFSAIKKQFGNAKTDIEKFESKITIGTAPDVKIDGNLRLVDAGDASAFELRSDQSSGSVGLINFKGENSNGNPHDYARITSQVEVSTAGSEEGTLILRSSKNGALEDRLIARKGGVSINTLGVGSALNMETDQDTAGDTVGLLNYRGHDNAASDVDYARITGTIKGSSAGSEIGRLDLITQNAGTLTTAFKIDFSDTSDPCEIFVGSSLKRVTQGATDSAGTGFRQLRVPN